LIIVFNLSKRLVPPRDSVYTVKLVELLETGKHDYLRHLVSSLHALEFPSGSPEPSLSGGNSDEADLVELLADEDDDVEDDED
jgi:hypothetical protein